MIHRSFLTPVFAGLVVLSPALPANEHSAQKHAEHSRANPDQVQIERLRAHLDTLSESLGSTQKAVEAIARQRDDARREVRQGQEDLLRTQQELKALKGKLSAAVTDAAKWKEKAHAVQMTQSDLQNFRKELQGAMTEFESLKGDFTKARSELQDPIERAEMKKAMASVKEEHAQLKREIELALKAREASIAETKKVQGEWEKAMRQAGQLKTQLKKEQGLNNGLKKRLEEALALNEANLKKLKESREQISESETKVAKLNEERNSLQQSLTSLGDRGVISEEDIRQREALEGQIAELSAQMEVAKQETASWKGRSEELATRLKERDAELTKVRDKLAKIEAAKPEADPSLSAELKRVKTELVRTQGELSYLHKSKGGLEDLLYRKTAEIQDLKGKLRKAEENQKPIDGETEVEPAKDESIGVVPIPKAIIVYEG